MKKFIAISRQYGELTVLANDINYNTVTFDSPEEAIEAVNDDLRETAVDLDENNFYTVYEVSASYRFVPPTDKGTLTPI